MKYKYTAVLILIFCTKILLVRTEKDWWKNAIIYEVFIQSFKDSDGDGIGDIKGITSKLDYFVDLGVDTIWITPFYVSPMADMGYDVSDYFNINPMLGTMKDFDELVREMKKKGLKLILDFVINHTSDEHPWFKKSVRKIKPYTDFYIWKNPKGFNKDGTPIPPNNWINLFDFKSAWKWRQERGQFYYRNFLEKQPELNLRNAAVKVKVKNIIKFWFDKGVSGARLDAAFALMEDILLRDEPLKDPKSNPANYFNYLHIHTTEQPDTFKFLHELREFVDNRYNLQSTDERILVPETISEYENALKYYGNESYKISHFPLNFDFFLWKEFPTPKTLDKIITNRLKILPSHGVTNWAVESHDTYRTGSKYNSEFKDIFLVIIMLVPGVPCIYYGQEIGMENTKVGIDPIVFKNELFEKHVPVRHPMQWDNSPNAGFTRKKKPWLSVNSDYWHVNVERQKKDPNSRYNLFKILSKLRKNKTLKYGKFKSYVLSSRSYAFTRSTNITKEMKILVAMNLSFERDRVNLGKHIPNLPAFGEILASSENIRNEFPESSYHPLKFTMGPLSVIVLKV